MTKETADFSKGLTIDDMPLNSAGRGPAPDRRRSQPLYDTLDDRQRHRLVVTGLAKAAPYSWAEQEERIGLSLAGD